MKRILIFVCLAGLVGLCLPSPTWAASSKSQSKQSILSRLSPSNVSKTLRSVGRGTRKVVRDTLDVVTLKSVREKKTQKQRLDEPSKPWLNNKTKNTTKKKSFWSSLVPSEEEPKRVETMKDFVGLKRPG